MVRRRAKNVTMLRSAVLTKYLHAKILIMMKFDQRYEKYKAPFGAVEAGSSARFFMETDRDDSKSTQALGRCPVGISGAREEGGVSFTPGPSGIVWYYFLIDGPERQAVITAASREREVYTQSSRIPTS